MAGSFLVCYTRSKAEALGLKGDVGIGSRAERVVVITAGLVLAPWGGSVGDLPPRGDGLDHRRAADLVRAQATARTRLTLFRALARGGRRLV